ncbi:luciferin 4-monooxygenase-like protein [Lasius niger]|uniref:Luciferin 4-monooxygenase-like protein n=1 Tax=Lasius niger TaxID=67767 RepID=A0A0J7KT57_LASNI|nr:luciferin 4-monooxygenase-like protein [Lasius niger]
MSKQAHILHGEGELIAELDFSVGQLLLRQLTIHNTSLAQIDAHTGKEQTFKYILDTSRKLAIYLQKEGLKVNDAVAVCSENNLEFCIPVCATFYLGAIVCPLNPLYSKGELKHALTISKPKYIFISAVALNNMISIFKELHWSPRVLLLNDYGNTDIPWMSMCKAISSISDDNIDNFQAVPVDINNHVTAILCSSGTTGLAKGVMWTDKNITTIIRMYISNSDLANVMSLALLPFFHAYSFALLVIRLIGGSSCIVLSRFEEELFLRSVEKYKIEYLAVVPPIMVFLAKHPLVDKYDLSSVKRIWCGAAPLSEEIQKAVAKRLNISEIKQGYGLTETTLAVLRFPENTAAKFGSVGILVPGVSAKVIPLGEYETDKTLGPNCEGELCFKGDLIMKGYYNDEKSTRATIDKDGWLHTGDVGYYDEEGCFYVVDRIKELIKYKGYQVPPAELEAILLTYSGIKDAAVIGIPNEETGELPMAFVVKQDGANVREKDIIQYVNERVSNPKRLRGGVKFVDSIPKTPSEANTL